MNDPITPALSAEEWAGEVRVLAAGHASGKLGWWLEVERADEDTLRFVANGPHGQDVYEADGSDRHALAALALHGQAFGPTHEMLWWVESATALADHMHGLEPETSEDVAMRDQVAAFIRALLPPEHP